MFNSPVLHYSSAPAFELNLPLEFQYFPYQLIIISIFHHPCRSQNSCILFRIFTNQYRLYCRQSYIVFFMALSLKSLAVYCPKRNLKTRPVTNDFFLQKTEWVRYHAMQFDVMPCCVCSCHLMPCHVTNHDIFQWPLSFDKQTIECVTEWERRECQANLYN